MCSNEVARRRVSSLICNLRCGGAQRTARPIDTRTFARALMVGRPLPWAPNFRVLEDCASYHLAFVRADAVCSACSLGERSFSSAAALNKSPLFVTLVKMTGGISAKARYYLSR
jgi:hypothetical protein